MEIILSTTSKSGIPNANIVLSLGMIDDKILVADCQMDGTMHNLQENSNICVIGKYIRVKGTAQIHSNGKYFDLATENVPDFKVKHAILITINEVFDLDKIEAIKLETN
jgi:hypothetical protein